MSSNVALARRWFDEVWNQRRPHTIEEMITPGGVSHSESGDIHGPQQFREHVYEPLIVAFPDIHITVEDTVTEGDRVVVRWSAHGTHTGAGLGMPATNRKVSFRGMTWIRFRDGKMFEGYDCWNQAGLMHVLQTGHALPSIPIG
jgi:steroid delta-isomerase-like uncharacterized protein